MSCRCDPSPPATYRTPVRCSSGSTPTGPDDRGGGDRTLGQTWSCLSYSADSGCPGSSAQKEWFSSTPLPALYKGKILRRGTGVSTPTAHKDPLLSDGTGKGPRGSRYESEGLRGGRLNGCREGRPDRRGTSRRRRVLPHTSNPKREREGTNWNGLRTDNVSWARVTVTMVSETQYLKSRMGKKRKGDQIKQEMIGRRINVVNKSKDNLKHFV